MQEPTPLVVVPENQQLATEPARTVAVETKQAFAGKDDLKLALAAVFGLLAAAGINVAPSVPSNIETLVTVLVPFLVAGYARWQTERTKRDQAATQGEATREAVYAPASVAQIVQDVKAQEPVPAVTIPGPGVVPVRPGT
jgi:hypothetical protein